GPLHREDAGRLQAQGVSLPPWRRLGRSASGRGRAVDPARSATARGGRARRHAAEAVRRPLGGGERRALSEGRSPGRRAGAAGARPLDPRRGRRPASGTPLLLPLQGRLAHEPGGPDRDRASNRPGGARAHLRGGGLPALRARALHGLPTHGPRGPRPGRAPRRLLYEGGPTQYPSSTATVRLHDSREPRGLGAYRRRHALYRPTRTFRGRTRPSPGSSPGTTTRWRTTMPTRSPSAASRTRRSCSAGRRPIRPTTSTCRYDVPRCLGGPTCGSSGAFPTATLRTSSCSTPGSTAM
ncbi:MAG: Phosphodiesterase/alkaline phosphatase D, partial [uncultured Solirubrobacterales bacterium]